MLPHTHDCFDEQETVADVGAMGRGTARPPPPKKFIARRAKLPLRDGSQAYAV